MSVLIGSARSSFGNTAPGDQHSGLEVSTQKWYLHAKGWYVLRAKDAAARERIAVAMERACANNNIGYSQPTRNTLYSDVKPYGFDPAKTTKKVNTDCSALVRVCVNFAGIAAGDFITSSEVRMLMATGAFELFTDDAHCKRDDYLLRGDILVTRTKGVVKTVHGGDKLVKVDSKDWIPVNIGGEVFWISPKAAEEAPVQAGELLVAGGSWNLRRGPGTQYGVVKTVHGGDKLVKVDPKDWIPVNIGGEVCWISPKAILEG